MDGVYFQDGEWSYRSTLNCNLPSCIIVLLEQATSDAFSGAEEKHTVGAYDVTRYDEQNDGIFIEQRQQ